MAKDDDTAAEPTTPHMPSPGEDESVAATEDAEKDADKK